MRFLDADSIQLDESEWTSADREQWAQTIQLPIVRKALKVVEETANQMLYGLGLSLDVGTEEGRLVAVRRQGNAKGIKAALEILQEMAADDEPEQEENEQ